MLTALMLYQDGSLLSHHAQFECQRAKFSDVVLGLIMEVSALISNETTSLIDAVLTLTQVTPYTGF